MAQRCTVSAGCTNVAHYYAARGEFLCSEHERALGWCVRHIDVQDAMWAAAYEAKHGAPFTGSGIDFVAKESESRKARRLGVRS